MDCPLVEEPRIYAQHQLHPLIYLQHAQLSHYNLISILLLLRILAVLWS